MSWTCRNLATTALCIGVIALGCGGSVIEGDHSSDSGVEAGVGGASAGGGSGGSAGTGKDGGIGGQPHGGSAGTGGNGHGGFGQGGASGASGASGAAGNVPACLNPGDLAVVQAGYDAGTIEEVAVSCAMGCLSDITMIKPCVSKCVKETTGGTLSTACADCYGGNIDCIVKNCLAACASAPSSSDCESCRCGNNTAKVSCVGEFSSCSGIPDSTCAAP